MGQKVLLEKQGNKKLFIRSVVPQASLLYFETKEEDFNVASGA